MMLLLDPVFVDQFHRIFVHNNFFYEIVLNITIPKRDGAK